MRTNRFVILIFVLLALAFTALGVRCFYLQYFKNDYYKEKSILQQQKITCISPQRGSILDCRGRVLAASNQTQTIFAEPRRIKNPEKVSAKLAPILKIEAMQIYKKIVDSHNPGFARLADCATFQQCGLAKKVDPGIGVMEQWQRYYPMPRLTCHIVGFTGDENRGLDGLEMKFDEILGGTQGSGVYFADKFRRTIRPKQTQTIVEDGQTLILTIDSTIQEFVHSELEKRFLDYQAESATAIVAEPQTGAILAMVSLPDYDPKNRNCDPNNFRNRAITDQYEPGSMLKPIVAAIALDAGVVNTHEKIFCENGNYHGKGFGRIGEYNYHKYGNLSVHEILVKSSNIGMAKIGQRFKNKEQLYNGLRLFGFGKKTGIDLPGEVSGMLSNPKVWTGYSITRIPFGQEITVTTLQMIKAFCILSNGGRAVTPYVVEAIVDNDGTITKIKRPPPSVGYVIDPDVAKWVVTDALVGVVNEKANGGTGWRAKLDKWQVYGKTGTANIALKDKKGYSKNDYVASFIAGAPAENPAIVVLVSIRKPDRSLGKGYTGGAVASPVVRNIIEKTLTYMERQGLL